MIIIVIYEFDSMKVAKEELSIATYKEVVRIIK